MSKLEPEAALPSSPCPKDFVPINDGSMSADIFRQWLGIHEMTCGPRLFYDARSGEQLSDQEILVRIFNGSTIDAVVSLPATAALLLGALTILWSLRRGQ